jgi:hypothetical protein
MRTIRWAFYQPQLGMGPARGRYVWPEAEPKVRIPYLHSLQREDKAMDVPILVASDYQCRGNPVGNRCGRDRCSVLEIFTLPGDGRDWNFGRRAAWLLPNYKTTP